MLRRYKYTHDQLNTRHYIIIYLGIFLRGGAQNSSLPPGARYPRYATVTMYTLSINPLVAMLYNSSIGVIPMSLVQYIYVNPFCSILQ